MTQRNSWTRYVTGWGSDKHQEHEKIMNSSFLIVLFIKVRMFMQDHAVAQIKLSAEKEEKEEKGHCKKEHHAEGDE